MIFRAAEGPDLCREVSDFLYNMLQVSIGVTNVTKVDRTTYVVQVGHFSQKLQIMRNRRKLNYVEGMVVQIYPDYTEREKQIQARIQRAANDARRNGSVVRAGYMKLYTDGKQWVWNEDKNELVEVTNCAQLSWLDWPFLTDRFAAVGIGPASISHADSSGRAIKQKYTEK